MTQQHFLRIALPTPLRRLFDYLPPEVADLSKIMPGVRVKVPFQSRTLVGILIEVSATTDVPANKLKSAIEILDDAPILNPDVYELCEWAASYYHYSLGEVLSAAMPVMLRKGGLLSSRACSAFGRGDPETLLGCFVVKDTPRNDGVLHLNPDQQLAIEKILKAKNKFQPFLLDGVTGSGKTEVYLRVIDEILKDQQQVLVLVPEISLTPQTISRFQNRFSVPIVSLHSNLSDKERLLAWSQAKEGTARMVIGTRSAIFTCFQNLGLIVIDEEHDASFKQQDRFRYHARDLAIMRASKLNIPVVLGSATPSLETILNAERKRYVYLNLPKRAGVAALPTLELIDLRNVKLAQGLSFPLLEAIEKELQENNQVMLFLNRRGFAPVLYCTECAWIANCKRCDANLVYHRKPEKLHCHVCDARKPIPPHCPECQQTSLEPIGLGTQRIEEALKARFPDVPIIRVDRDSTRKKGALHDLLDQIHATKKAILLGTQMLAKGHHFRDVTLVGILDADNGLFSADFRAGEQLGQLLMQVAGRAGRENKPGTVLIQTRYPDHPLLNLLLSEGYQSYAKALLQEREGALLPPYSYVAVLRAEAHKEETVGAFLHEIKMGQDIKQDQITVLGPAAPYISKKKGMHTQHLVLRAEKRSDLHQYLNFILQKIDMLQKTISVKWILDVDPVEVG